MNNAYAEMINKAVEAKIIDPQAHFTFLGELDNFADLSGVPVLHILTPISKYCGPAEVSFVKNIKNLNSKPGLVYLGVRDYLPRMSSLVGCCVRNFIDARMVPMNKVVAGLKDGDPPSALGATVIALPNLLPEGTSRGIAEWDKAALYGWFASRMMSGKRTILHLPNWAEATRCLGEGTTELLQGYEVISR